ncbi:FecR family protein [Gaoshiqia sp. Z1-71]|uniref:FecR family protein n=1 Tax=Gaoshiqia hydrogeniformans TaxID=3290090 RepID=UPI003BF8157A
MKNSIPADKIIRNITSNGEEYAGEIREWLDDSNDNKKIYSDFLNIWRLTGSFPERFYPNRKNAWLKVQKQIHTRKRSQVLYRRMAQVAAAILVISFSVWAGSKLSHLENTAYTEIISPAGQKSRIILPDSSVVLLNSHSRIRYRQDFNVHDRHIELNGEAYFEVRKNLMRQFIVSVTDLNIKVYGTSFNVKAYEEDQIIEVGLKNGSIGIDCNEKEIIQLVPGQVAVFNKNETKLDVENVDMNMVSAWTRDEMIFEERSMEEIVKYIERWYGVEIKLDPKLIDGELLTFKVKTESLQDLLKLINLLKPITYQVDGKQVVITKP